MDFEIETDHIIPVRRPHQVIANKKRKNLAISEFVISGDHRVKNKENENRNKNLDLARELKKQWNMKVTVIPTVTGVFGTLPKWLGKRDWKY